MAVLVEAISVVIRKSTIAAKYPHGLEGFRKAVPNATLCEDEFLARVGFMTPDDARDYVEQLEACGLIFLSQGKPVDLVVADQQQGFTVECDWATFVHAEIGPGQTVSACEATEQTDPVRRVALPRAWEFEESISATNRRLSGEEFEATMEPLVDSDGLTFRNRATGEVVYIGSPTASEKAAEFEEIKQLALKTLRLDEMAASARSRGNERLGIAIQRELRTCLLPEAQSLAMRAKFQVGFAHFAHGLVLRVLQERELAIEQFKRSLEDLPNGTNTLIEIVRCFGELGRVAEGYPYAVRAVEVEPQSPATWGNLASTLIALKRGDEAWAAVKRAVALDPENAINRNLLDVCRTTFGSPT